MVANRKYYLKLTLVSKNVLKYILPSAFFLLKKDSVLFFLQQ